MQRRLRIGAVGAAVAAASCAALGLLEFDGLFGIAALALGLLALSLGWLSSAAASDDAPPPQPAAGALALGLMAFADSSTLPRSAPKPERDSS
jgi:hypothetical protein